MVGIQVKMGLSAGNGPRFQEREPQLVRAITSRPAVSTDTSRGVRGASRSDVGAVACHDSPASTADVHTRACAGESGNMNRDRDRGSTAV